MAMATSDDDEEHDDFDQCTDDGDAFDTTERQEGSGNFICRPLVGDAMVEAALDEYLTERDDEIFIHHLKRRDLLQIPGLILILYFWAWARMAIRPHYFPVTLGLKKTRHEF